MSYIFMKHPMQGFIKGVKKDSPDIILQLKSQGWYQCQDRNDATPYKAPVKKKSKAKKTTKSSKSTKK